MTDIRPFTTINHKAQIALGLSLTEYCLADAIHNLASNPGNPVPGWCWASRSTLAGMLGVNDRTVYRALQKLSELGLVEMDSKANVRATPKWFKATNTDKVSGRSDKMSVRPMTKSHTTYRKNKESKQGLTPFQDMMFPR